MSALPRLALALALGLTSVTACDSSSEEKSDEDKKEAMKKADLPGQEDCEKFHEKLVDFAVAKAAGDADLPPGFEAEIRKKVEEDKEKTIAECTEKGSKTVINCAMKQKTLEEFEANCSGQKK